MDESRLYFMNGVDSERKLSGTYRCVVNTSASHSYTSFPRSRDVIELNRTMAKSKKEKFTEEDLVFSEVNPYWYH